MPNSQPQQGADASLPNLLPGPRRVALAATEMMWAVALAATRASFASTARGLAFWSDMLRAPAGVLLDASAVSAGEPPGSGSPTSGSSDARREADGNAARANAPGEEALEFARYRSSGGHAAAQVITEH